eukprot:scaffold70150_cov49-Phaeocystis_antarctica.AAC.2
MPPSSSPKIRLAVGTWLGRFAQLQPEDALGGGHLVPAIGLELGLEIRLAVGTLYLYSCIVYGAPCTATSSPCPGPGRPQVTQPPPTPAAGGSRRAASPG